MVMEYENECKNCHYIVSSNCGWFSGISSGHRDGSDT